MPKISTKQAEKFLTQKMLEKYLEKNISRYIAVKSKRPKSDIKIYNRIGELEIIERIVRVEEAIKGQNDRIDLLLRHMDKRFESMQLNMDKRFEQVDKRFEQVDKRFEQVDKRFEEMNKRFTMLVALLAIGFTALALLMSVYKFVR